MWCRKKTDRHGNRGIVLISGLLVLALFLAYSSSLTQSALTQQRAADQLHDRLQASHLAQGALEQLREDFYIFLTSNVYQVRYQGDALPAMQWLDNLDPTSGASTLDPPFVLNNVTGVAEGATPLSEQAPRRITLPSGLGQAWITSVASTNPADPLAARDVTIEAMATVGGTTKRIRATYRIALGMSDVFRYAYFINNYGWFDVGPNANVYIRGEFRANGDVDFQRTPSRLFLDGDIYASQNQELINPSTGKPAEGLISGDPNQTPNQFLYWRAYAPYAYSSGPASARPTQRVTFPGQPAIGGSAKVLKDGYGWDSDNPEQVRYAKFPTQPIPYLGNLNIYKSLAAKMGGSLSYRDDQDGKKKKTISAIYAGPDGIPSTSDDNNPVVLVGTKKNPIVLDGPVVIPGDVIIKGVVTGRGTIYAGRNVHIVGETTYQNPPQWTPLERNQVTGRLSRRGCGGFWCNGEGNLGTVCKNGTYYKPGVSVPKGCMK